MESYTIEDIEVIRKKSGISYQEAVALLDYHNGNLARALIDLERNGRLLDEEGETTSSTRSSNRFAGHSHGFPGLINRLCRARLKVFRNKTIPIMNISLLYTALAAIFAPHLCIISAVAAVLLGYNFTFDSSDEAFADETIQKMVNKAKNNARNTVNSVVRNFSGELDKTTEKKAEVQMETAPDAPVQESSYYTSNPAATRSVSSAFAASDVPTIQIPVQVEAGEGNVSVEENNDGSSSVTIG